jgi:NAD-dependent deacetylase
MSTFAPLNLESYRRIFILTGAGVSVASGLPTYRGPGGLWNDADIARIVEAENLPGSLPDLWKLYRGRREQVLQSQPNAAHYAIANLQRTWSKRGNDRRVMLATQNIDDLHQRAGSPDVLELHGSGFMTRCSNERCTAPPFRDEALYDEVPLCAECGSPLRPAVVLFGEMLPEHVLYRVAQALGECDLFISVGTSGQVWPAARFVQAAVQVGARTISVNVERSDNPHFQEEYLGRAEEVLPQLLGSA